MRLVGEESVKRLAALFAEPFNQIKLRRTEATEGGAGQCIGFHLDFSERTMQVPLNSVEEYTGGRLVFVTREGGLEYTSRRAGSATIHDNGVVHGVTEMRRGVRYALFILRAPVIMDKPVLGL